MNKIDELVGKELAEAVAVARGWQRGFGGFWTLPSGPLDGEGEREIYLYDYRPDRDVAQAWELDGEEWLWDFRDHRSGLYLDAIAYRGGHIIGMARVVYARFLTKPVAYATARCRAFLKAKEARR